MNDLAENDERKSCSDKVIRCHFEYHLERGVDEGTKNARRIVLNNSSRNKLGQAKYLAMDQKRKYGITWEVISTRISAKSEHQGIPVIDINPARSATVSRKRMHE